MTVNLKSMFMLDPNVVYLNHGSYGACPRPVFDQYQAWQRELEINPMHFIGQRLSDLMEKARNALGAYLGTNGENIVYFANPTTALRMICRSLRLAPGEEILTTDWEYPGMDSTWDLVAYQTGAKYIHQPVPVPISTSDDFVDALWKGVSERTRIIYISHIAAFSALIFPVEAICRRARKQNIITIIDGAHAVSQIPLDMNFIDADVYIGACHKWLCSPKGAGFAYARPSIQNYLVDALVNSRQNGEPTTPNKQPFVPQYQHQGTRDPSAFLSVPAAIAFQDAHDWEFHRQRCHDIASYTRCQIDELTGLQPLSPDSGDYFGQMVSIRVPFEAVEAIRSEFVIRNIVGVILRVNDQSLLRVSYQAYNTQEDADLLIEAVKEGLGAI